MKKNILFFILIIVISIFAFLPHEDIPHSIDSINTNYYHILTFIVITMYMYSYKKYTHLNIFIFIFIFGFYIEITQLLFTTRQFSIKDIGYDILGYLICIMLIQASLIFKRINILKK